MGIYVNPGNIPFQESRFSSIYIDKSMLISKMNGVYRTERKFVCVSRPRRFGKSMAANMLTAYYSRGCDSAKLFSGLKIENEQTFQEHLNRHNVVRIDVQRFLETEGELDGFIGEIEKNIVCELRKEFPCQGSFGPDSRLKTALDQIFAHSGEGFIIIIDEWDCVFRAARNHKKAQKAYLDFLRGLFKGADYVELAYMTGILPIKKYGEHSALNIFDEYSMISPKNLGEYFGFTKEEVQKARGCQKVEYEDIKRWYDGYRLGKLHIYNPKSVADALTWDEIQSYWTGTETYEALKVYIDMNFDGLKEAVTMMLGNGRCAIDPSAFQNDMTTFRTRDDVLTLLVHLGYLTYDTTASEVFIPNQEIEQEFVRALKAGGWEGVIQSLNRSHALLESTWAMDGRAVAEGMAAVHKETASLLKYNQESSLTCAVLMAFYSAKIYYVNPVMEFPSGKGFADVVYLPKQNVDRPALVIELKWDKSARGAVQQIKEKEYASWFEEYTGDILLVGINYLKKTKVYECVIEKYDSGENSFLSDI